jgi:threonine aldolase
MNRIIDLRSDTVTKPTPDMWEALKSLDDSKLGDDVFGEDPTVNKLEEEAAKLMNKEAGLLVTSGTQGNLVSLLSHTSPGEEILVESQSHIFLYEVGSAARIGGLTTKVYSSKYGVPEINMLEEMIRERDDIHQPWTTLLTVENTHNMHGGKVINPQELASLAEFTKDNNLKFHMDGARIFNAAVALEKPVSHFTNHVDSMMFCLSKGMACPIGSLVVGSQDFIDKARKFRKMLGGGMRQAGIIAIMGLIALQHDWKGQLKRDHDHALILAKGIADIDERISVKTPDTNIINITMPEKTQMKSLVNSSNKRGVLLVNKKGPKIRIVTHVGISRDDINQAIIILSEEFKKFLPS